ncbi:MAG: hypothetical protein WDO56_24495 [Gammaproteobacteria bacterium]
MKTRNSMVWIVACLCLSASAEEAPQEPPPELPAEVKAAVPPMDCAQPKIPERASMPVEDIDFFIKKVNAYGDCVSAYVTVRQVDIKKYSDLARAHAEAGNSAVKEIGDYRAKVVAFQEKHNPRK